MKINQLKQELTTSTLDQTILKTVVDPKLIDTVKQRLLTMLDHYIQKFGVQDDVIVVSTPGRSEVCGNHTDHQHGKVVATSINLDALAIVSKDNDGITIDSDGYTIPTIHYHDLKPDPALYGTSQALITGVLDGLLKHGHTIGGFHGVITSTVLAGSGLSSSACFEVLIGTILSALYNDSAIDPLTLAKIAQYAENVYFGKPSGLMDQCACAIGGLITIDFKDPKDPLVQPLSIDFDQFYTALVIIDTHGSHADLTDAYASIPNDMHTIAKWFNQNYLADVDPTLFFANIAKLRHDLSDAAILRALHFYDENKRVERLVDALKANDFVQFKSIIAQSGDSSYRYLRNVWIPNQDDAQNLALALALSDHWLRDHGVARVHGGGFAGTIQAFVDLDFVNEYKTKMEAVFGQGSVMVLQVRPIGTCVLIH